MAIIPTAENTAVTVIRDAPATTRVSGVSEAGAQRIMALSIDLYSDPVLAVVLDILPMTVLSKSSPRSPR